MKDHTQSSQRLFRIALVVGLALLALGVAGWRWWPRAQWSEAEVAMLRALWIGALPALPPDPSNAVGDDPRAAALGQALFFDTRLSSNGAVACATCHAPDLDFQDGKPLSEGVGVTDRRAMPIAGTAYSPWLFWDGRKDSLWAQALGPLENPVEHDSDRMHVAHLVAEFYRSDYAAIFGELPDLSGLPAHAGPVPDPNRAAAWALLSTDEQAMVNRIFANVGKSIAAFERQIMPGPARFDRYVEAVLAGDRQAMSTLLTPDEVAGLRLFIGKAECTQCHNGPLLTDNHFHNTGVPDVADLPADVGRALGAQQVLADEFNCLGPYSDALPEQCGELRFMVAEGHELVRQFKPPSLRNVAERPPYMHAGQLATLEEVVRHYNAAPDAPDGHSELQPLNLSAQEQAQLVAFLGTLSGTLVVPDSLQSQVAQR